MTKQDSKVDLVTVILIIFMIGVGYYTIFYEGRFEDTATQQTESALASCISYDESLYNINDLFELKRIQDKALTTGNVTSMEVDLFQIILNKPGRICDAEIDATIALVSQAQECHKTFYTDLLRSFDAGYVVVSPERSMCESELYGSGSQQALLNNQNIEKALLGQPVTNEYGTVYIDVATAISSLAQIDLKLNAVKSLYKR